MILPWTLERPSLRVSRVTRRVTGELHNPVVRLDTKDAGNHANHLQGAQQSLHNLKVLRGYVDGWDGKSGGEENLCMQVGAAR